MIFLVSFSGKVYPSWICLILKNPPSNTIAEELQKVQSLQTASALGIDAPLFSGVHALS